MELYKQFETIIRSRIKRDKYLMVAPDTGVYAAWQRAGGLVGPWEPEPRRGLGWAIKYCQSLSVVSPRKDELVVGEYSL